jgi:UDP-glucose 6-dehydrogenase
MNVICVGAGWVGVITMAVMAGHCPDVQFHIYDIDVDTNLKSYGMNQGKQYDLTNFYNVAKEISRQVDPLKQVIVIEKSTVPVKTGEILQSVLPGAIVLSNPEFPTIRSSPLISLPQNYQKLR